MARKGKGRKGKEAFFSSLVLARSLSLFGWFGCYLIFVPCPLVFFFFFWFFLVFFGFGFGFGGGRGVYNYVYVCIASFFPFRVDCLCVCDEGGDGWIDGLSIGFAGSSFC